MAASATAVANQCESQGSREAWTHALWLNCKLTVDLPLGRFTVADMLRLQPGSTIPAQWRVGKDVPLQVNGTLLAHGEFEVVGEHLAIRLTELV